MNINCAAFTSARLSSFHICNCKVAMSILDMYRLRLTKIVTMNCEKPISKSQQKLWTPLMPIPSSTTYLGFEFSALPTSAGWAPALRERRKHVDFWLYFTPANIQKHSSNYTRLSRHTQLTTGWRKKLSNCVSSKEPTVKLSKNERNGRPNIALLFVKISLLK